MNTFKEHIEKLSQPAQRALLNAGIDSLEKLKKISDQDLLKLHGFGKASLPIIQRLRELEDET
jgi:DNA repair protein RadC